MIKRFDLKAKAILKKNDIQMIQYNKNKKAPRVMIDGVEITQHHGELCIALNGMILTQDVQEQLQALDTKIYYYK